MQNNCPLIVPKIDTKSNVFLLGHHYLCSRERRLYNVLLLHAMNDIGAQGAVQIFYFLCRKLGVVGRFKICTTRAHTFRSNQNTERQAFLQGFRLEDINE